MKKPDIFFLSFDETNREKNHLLLKQRFPERRRIHGIKGLRLAHKMCARLSQTPFFFVVNGDNEIHKNFSFELPETPLKNQVYCWRCFNPAVNLVYGFGGIKLFPKNAFQKNLLGTTDISTSLRTPYKIVNKTASITRFNVSPLEAFRGAFRECVKLSSACIAYQKTMESRYRLRAWRSVKKDQPFGSYISFGAWQGEKYGLKYKDNNEMLQKINDFNWINRYFSQLITENNKKTYS